MNKTRMKLTRLAIILAGVLAAVIGLCVLTGTALAAPPETRLACV